MKQNERETEEEEEEEDRVARMSISSANKPHVLVMPMPVQGHIIPTMHFSQKLVARGIMVTFVTVEYRVAHMRRAAEGGFGITQLELESGGLFRMVGLDDGLPADNPRSPIDMAFMRAVESLSGALEQLISSIDSDQSLPSVTCLVSDSYLPWTLDVALKCGIPRALFWTMSFATCCCYVSMSKIVATGHDPMLTPVTCRGILPPTDLVVEGLPPIDPYDLPFNWEGLAREENENTQWLRRTLESQFHRMDETAWVISNSFQAIEAPFIDALCNSSIIPRSKLLLLGPLCDEDVTFRGSLWQEEESQCLEWLDSQEDNSVLYISFGSIVTRAQNDIREVAEALVACRQPFLWALRRCWDDEVRQSLSEEFFEFAKQFGKLTTWTPQLKVLSHRAVAGFLSHAGWNSTTESVTRGVPMLAWPCFLDQFTNSWEMSCVWGTGVQLMRPFCANEIEKAIKTLMRSDQTLSFRKRASELQAASSGASSAHFSLFVEDMFRRAAEKTPLAA
ncbi:hypothetical protein KP509_19G060800 [Ceratopteris richardii]|uniref:Glycosyltransferase n=1 Tax=Ceratopteris richardii TaxID=49495 RepID=A0A8T2SLL1_CERRI|nr:hypothetical protein KP509_19G060800 [Ceratopteris richardii]